MDSPEGLALARPSLSSAEPLPVASLDRCLCQPFSLSPCGDSLIIYCLPAWGCLHSFNWCSPTRAQKPTTVQLKTAGVVIHTQIGPAFFLPLKQAGPLANDPAAMSLLACPDALAHHSGCGDPFPHGHCTLRAYYIHTYVTCIIQTYVYSIPLI